MKIFNTSIFILILPFILSEKCLQNHDLINMEILMRNINIYDEAKLTSDIESCLINIINDQRKKIYCDHNKEEQLNISIQEIMRLAKNLNINSNDINKFLNKKILFSMFKELKLLSEKKTSEKENIKGKAKQNKNSVLTNIGVYFFQFKNSIGSFVLLFSYYFLGIMISQKVNDVLDLKEVFKKRKDIKKAKSKRKKQKEMEKINN